MTSLLNTLANAIDSKEDLKKRSETAKIYLQELLTSVQNCQDRFGSKSELATEDDIRIAQLCEKWEKVLGHGIRTNLSNSALQSLVAAGLNFTFNIVNIGNSLWSYTCLHLTKHEKERFKILSNINTPLGYFRAFLRASLNERSLERYLQSWLSHGLLMEYYEEGALVRVSESSNLLPNMAAGLSSILFALAIDKAELNDVQQSNQVMRSELVIPLPTPIKPSGNTRKKPLRQVISFDKNEQNHKDKICDRMKSLQSVNISKNSFWNSAPATCLNSPDPRIGTHTVIVNKSNSEPTTSDHKSIRHFFPDTVRTIDSPSQIFARLSGCAKEIFSSSNSVSVDNSVKDDSSDKSTSTNIKLSESDSDEVAGSIDGSTSCLELCFNHEDPNPILDVDKTTITSVLELKDKDYLALQMKYNQLEINCKQKIVKLENVVLDLSRENERLKEQLRHYISAIEMTKNLKANPDDMDEISQYERKLIQVAEMHAELMEFNQYLQKRLQEAESANAIEILERPESNVKVHIPTAFLVGKRTHSYHVYQIFLKVGSEDWNVFHRYATFYELHKQLKKCHPDLANYNFPPKKTLGKKNEHLVEQRRLALQAYLRHVVLVLPELQTCTSRASLVTLLPFFGSSSASTDRDVSRDLQRQQSNISASVYEPL